MGLPPCVLCWYQRICMYPLVVVTTVGLLHRDARAASYAWPLVIAGLAVAVYHNLLYYHVIPESITPCAQGVSCTDRQIEWLGFITIPLLSLTGFAAIAGCLGWFRARAKGHIRADQ
jgi:disulfide bond formation protein DsbB